MDTNTQTQSESQAQIPALTQSLISTLALGAMLGLMPLQAQAATEPLPTAVPATLSAIPSAELLAEGRRVRLHAIRLYHARELLGRAYKSSVVKATESTKDVESFVLAMVRKSLPAAWKKDSERISRAILTQSIEHGFDPIFLISVMWTESSFRPEMIGGVGEIGLMQIRPETAAWLSKKIGYSRYAGRTSLFDPVVNIELGAAYFAMLRQTFDDDGQLYISAYNMGTTNVRRALANSKRPSEYSGRVLGRYRELYRSFAPSFSTTRVNRKIAMN
jgi:soluble lytic murein transglycosylase